MIVIIARFETKPDYSERWSELVAPLTAATRAEQGNLWFDWSRSLDNPAEYVLVEAFRDSDAGGVHVQSGHFKEAQRTLPPYLAETPRIVNFTLPQDDWSLLGEMAVPDQA